MKKQHILLAVGLLIATLPLYPLYFLLFKNPPTWDWVSYIIQLIVYTVVGWVMALLVTFGLSIITKIKLPPQYVLFISFLAYAPIFSYTVILLLMIIQQEFVAWGIGTP